LQTLSLSRLTSNVEWKGDTEIFCWVMKGF
jgi:hypothetical protein